MTRSMKTEASASEKYLSSLWSEVIGLDSVELSDTFLEVGGNSLTLQVILTRICTERGAELEPQLFFDPDTSSVSQLAKELDRLLENPRSDRSDGCGVTP